MPLPLILGAAAAVAGAAGVGSAIHGGVKMKKANDTMKQTQEAHTANVRRFEIRNERCTAAMDRLGKLELEILQSFQKFSDIFERIQNKPEFRAFKHGDVTIPTYSPEDLKKVSGLLLLVLLLLPLWLWVLPPQALPSPRLVVQLPLTPRWLPWVVVHWLPVAAV